MKKDSFNLGWIYYKVGNEKDKKKVDLPHDAMIYEVRSKESKAGAAGGYFDGGKYIYEKNFHVPPDWISKSVIIEFEGVYQKSTILLNDKEIYKNTYGYSNFFVSLNKHIKYGERNKLTVIADNSNFPNSRWYSGSGIYRNVKLYTGNKIHIVPDEVLINGDADGNVKLKVCVTGGTQLNIIILKDNIVHTKSGIAIKEQCTETLLKVEKPSLWDDENPNLYTCQIELMKDGEVVDVTEQKFGFRTIDWNPNKGLTVNGKEVLLRGSCIHHDNGVLGAAAFDAAEKRKIRLHKEAGFNAIRSSHNPCSKVMLDACDELGIYVMDEFADQWLIHKTPYDYANEDFLSNWQADVSAMIKKDYSHPSVIMYSIGNEISEFGIKEGVDYARKIVDFVKMMDSSRAVTAGINLMLATMAAKGKGMYSNENPEKNAANQSMDSVPTSAFFNILMNRMGNVMDSMAAKKSADKVTEQLEGIFDINGYNYATSRYVKEGNIYPNRVIVGSETLPKSIYKNWKLVKQLPYLVGDFVWTGWDYLGESGIGTVQYKSEKTNNNLIISGGAGLIDICGKMRPEIEWYRMIWGMTQAPIISVEPLTHAGDLGSISMWRETDGVTSWTWPGCEGKKNKIRVYATGKSIELIVNGKSYGQKKTKEYIAVFKNVVYEPGVIIAKSFDENGFLINQSELRTSKGETKISLKAESHILIADGEDICFINIDLTGEDGITKSSVDVPVTVEVSGMGSLIALGSAKPAPKENFVSNSHTTYLGKAQAIVRAGTEAGKIKVRVSASGLESKELQLEVVKN